MENLSYITLRQRPELKEQAARWFHGKWGVPTGAYLQCMESYLKGETEYGWYLCLCGGEIVGGLGVIFSGVYSLLEAARERRECRPDTIPEFERQFTT